MRKVRPTFSLRHLAVCLPFLSAALIDCSGEEFETTCAENPTICPAGRTCWLSAEATAFVCLNSGPAGEGEPCTLKPGAPDCSDGLICYAVTTDPNKVCVPSCSPTNPDAVCPSGRQCVPIQSEAGVFHACRP